MGLRLSFRDFRFAQTWLGIEPSNEIKNHRKRPVPCQSPFHGSPIVPLFIRVPDTWPFPRPHGGIFDGPGFFTKMPQNASTSGRALLNFPEGTLLNRAGMNA